MKRLFVVLVCLITVQVNGQKFEYLAQTPPMGWNSWNKFACDINEDIIKGVADAMVESGMSTSGYEYIVIDDCWQIDRDENGRIVVDPVRFPSGMKSLADYVHSQGLKFGIYSCAGTATCQGRPGGRGYEFQDALTYADWGVDYLKYDWCNTSTQDAEASYTLMRDALYEAGRPVVFSLCEWGTHDPWEWAGDIGHLWRTTGDIRDNWNSMLALLDQQDGLEEYAGPGQWNDPDMLEVGNGGMTTEEYKAHFSLWCMLAAPLMAGNDLRNMDPVTLDILTNEEVIAVDQDPAGRQGFKFRDTGDYEIWVKRLAGEEKAICLLNRSDEVKNVQIDFALLLKANNNYWNEDPFSLNNYRVRDLWEHEEISVRNGTQVIEMSPHTVKMYRFIKR